ncbi:MAG: hypothetical protein WAN02_29735, partial [Mycobacterium sp.]
MAQRPSKRDRRPRKVKARRHRRAAGLATAAAAILGAAMTPLASAPVAHADGFDIVIDPIVNSIANSLASLLEPLAGLDSVSAADPLVSLGIGGLGSSAADLAGSSSLGVGSADSALTAASDPSPAASSFDAMLQTLAQEWITSQSGAAYDAQLNTLWHDVGGSGILIGNGANGTPDSTLT